MTKRLCVILQVTPWDLILQHIEVSSDRGILLLVLLFALACCAVVSVITFFRWIVYKVQNKSKSINKSQVCSAEYLSCDYHVGGPASARL